MNQQITALTSLIDENETFSSGDFVAVGNITEDEKIARHAGGDARKTTEVIYFTIVSYIYLSTILVEWIGFINNRKKKLNKRNRFYSMGMRIGVMLALTFCFMLRTVALIGIYRVPLSDTSCDFAVRCKPIFWAATTLLVYFVLWFKQRILYGNPSLRHLTNNLTRFLSAAVVVLFTVAHTVNGVLLAVSQRGKNTEEHGCVEIPTLVRHQFAISTSVSVTLIVTQFTLLMLFTYPLIRHSKNVANTESSKSLLSMLIRTFMTALFCGVTDGFGPIGIMIVKDIQSYKFYYFGISLIVDVVCVNLCFKNWLSRLFPLYLICDNSEEEDKESDSSNGKTTTISKESSSSKEIANTKV